MDINKTYWLGDLIDHGKWKQYTLNHRITNRQGGSESVPIGRVELIYNPGIFDISYPHMEVRVVLRNNIKQAGNEMIVYPELGEWNKVSAIIDSKDLDELIGYLTRNNLVNEPFSVAYSIEDVQYFDTVGEVFDLDIDEE